MGRSSTFIDSDSLPPPLSLIEQSATLLQAVIGLWLAYNLPVASGTQSSEGADTAAAFAAVTEYACLSGLSWSTMRAWHLRHTLISLTRVAGQAHSNHSATSSLQKLVDCKSLANASALIFGFLSLCCLITSSPRLASILGFTRRAELATPAIFLSLVTIALIILSDQIYAATRRACRRIDYGGNSDGNRTIGWQ